MTSPGGLRKKPAKRQRFYALDSLRGIAAFAVALQHSSLMIPEAFRAQLPDWVTLNPLRIFLNGYAAVLLFFVLSGYVLAIPYVQNREEPYLPFLVKRVCRIYIPFVFAIFTAAFLYYMSAPNFSDEGSSAFRHWWGMMPLTPEIIARHAAMTGMINDMWLDSPIWSLVHEMRISILFPMVVLLCRNLRMGIVIALLIGFGAPYLAVITDQDWSLDTSDNLAGTFLITLRFIPFFMLGILLAKYNEAIRLWLGRKPRGKAWWGLAAALVVFYLPTDIETYSRGEAVAYHDFIGALLGLTGGLLIILARNVPQFEILLNIPPLRWLGRISYSLYLVHLPIMLFLFREFLGELPFPLISLLVIVTALAFASLFHLAIERPAMRLGRYIAALNGGRAVEKPA